MEPPRPSQPTLSVPSQAPEVKFPPASQIGFFRAVRDIDTTQMKPEQVKQAIATLFRTNYKCEMTNEQLQDKIRDLTQFLKDPNAIRNELIDKMIDGASKVVTYLKTNASLLSKATQQLKPLEVAFNEASEKYHLDYAIEEGIRQGLGYHGIPKEFDDAIAFIRSKLDSKVDYEGKSISMRALLFSFLKNCEELKLENLQLLGHNDGNMGKIDSDDPDCQRIAQQLLAINIPLRSESSVIPDPVLREKLEIVPDIFNTIAQGAINRNVQLNSETFESVIPQPLRGNFSEERHQVRVQSYQNNREAHRAEDEKARADIEKSSMSAESKRKALQALDDRHHYVQGEGYLFYHMCKWSDVTLNKHDFFEKGVRTLGFMTLDREKKFQENFPLNLSRVDIANEQQLKDAFEFLFLIVSAIDPKRSEAWVESSKNPKEFTLDELKGMLSGIPELLETLDSITSLSNDQKRELLKEALPFSYYVQHFLVSKRLELSIQS